MKQDYKYINPDDMMYHGKPEITFIFTPDGQVIATDGHTPHNELVFQEPEYRSAVMGRGAKLGEFQRNKMIVRNLLGRIGTMGQERLVCFWNSPLDVFNANVAACLRALQGKGYIDADTRISAPTVYNQTVGQFLGGSSQQTQANPEAERMADLARQMHTMRGDQKKSVMNQLGVGMPYKQHPWSAEMQKIGQAAPGWKLGLTSEELET